jgi:hypothetical protein
MATDELAGRDFDLELGAELEAALGFSLSTTVRDEYVRPAFSQIGPWSAKQVDLHFDAVFVLAIQSLHGLYRLRDDGTAFDQNAVDIKGECELIRHQGLARACW